MKAVIVKVSELGTNCWSPLRFVKSCFQCSRYRYCEYPERVVSKEFDALVSAVYIVCRKYAKAKQQMKEFIEGG